MDTKKILRTFAWSIILILLLLLVGIVLLKKGITNSDIQIFSVDTNSMHPTVSRGDIIIIQPRKEYFKNDVITFHINEKDNQLVTHRIESILQHNNTQTYQTRGDANNVSDSVHITYSQIVGKVRFIIPYLGFIFLFANTDIGIIMLILIPLTILMYTEMSDIIRI